MDLERYLELIRSYPDGDSKHLNLQSNFKIGLGVDHRTFCDLMISSGKFNYQYYAPKYNPQDSYLIWHERVLELRVWRGLTHHFKTFSEADQNKLKILVQTNPDSYESADTEIPGIGPLRKNPPNERLRIMKEIVMYLMDTSIKNRFTIGIPDIYFNHPQGPESMLWLPE